MIEVAVEDPAWQAALPAAGELARAAAAAAVPADAAVTILLADDDTLRDLNARFRGRDRPTNVLSFPAPASAAPHLGDLALAYGVCAAEAEAQGKSLADHLRHLVIHGALHLQGHDHETEAEAEAMEALERTLLAGMGVADPYRELR